MTRIARPTAVVARLLPVICFFLRMIGRRGWSSFLDITSPGARESAIDTPARLSGEREGPASAGEPAPDLIRG
jgi:hypothetical protein